MNSEPHRFAKGDSVVHPRRPEWGTGKVQAISAVAQPGGNRAQRVTIDFANKGRVTINTAVAPLEHQGSAPAPKPKKPNPRLTPSDPIPTPHRSPQTETAGTATKADGNDSNTGSGWLDAMDPEGAESQLWDLPAELTDPFASLGDRLKHTLETYHYSTEPRALMDWAVRQTRLDDPLSKYTRPELEQAFPRFARDRDQHLRDLVRQLKRQDAHATLKDCGRGLFPAAQSALDKAIRG